MLELIGHSKAEAGARSLALSQMEYIRSLDYEFIGTVEGVPSGNIAQTSTTTLNGVEYTQRVLILYVDRLEDGLEENDSNGVLEDSKRVKVEYSWNIRGEDKSYVLVSDIAPKGMETTNGGGTLIIKIFDAAVAPLVGVEVHIYNDSELSDVINMTTYSNSEGKVIVPGMPARGGYELTVTDTGYSTDATYDLTSENPNPDPAHVAVASSSITTMNFFIDQLSDLTLRTIEEPTTLEFSDDFSDDSLLAEMTSTAVVASELQLANDPGEGYVSSGSATATTTAPTTFTSWKEMDWTGSSGADTSFLVHLYTWSGGTYSLVSDIDLPGNSTGWSSGPIDISALSTSTYPNLALGAELSTSNASSTPVLSDWSLSYTEDEPPLSGITLDMAGNKTIGTGVLKYEEETVTDAGGLSTLSLEWDTYDISIDGVSEGYDIKEVRGILPYALEPGVTETLTFVLTPHTTNSLHVTVTEADNTPVVGASVELQATGYNETLSTSQYGQVFFSDAPTASSTISISKSGYDLFSDALNISGNDVIQVNLIPSL